jgi:glycosyltransferase involved in cell wall biosynthesis
MKNKAILFTTYPEAFFHKGGGEYELLEIALNMRKLGIVADVYSHYSFDINHYGIVIHFSIHPSGLPILEAAKAAGKKIILWPNFWAHKSATEASIISNRFLELADAVVFKSETEKTNFEIIAQPAKYRFFLVPTGIDPIFAEPTPDNLFKEIFGLNEYIVWVGIIEKQKNQLEVIQALYDLDIPIVFIGNYRDETYYQACRMAAPKHFVFLEPMEHKSDILRAAIRESQLYIEPTLEPAGKSVLEAATCGAKILVSDRPWEREHLGPLVTYVNPKDPDSLFYGVQDGLKKPADIELSSILKEKHLFPYVLNNLIVFLAEISTK